MLFVSALFNPLWMVDCSAHLSAQARLKVHRRGPCNGQALSQRNQACYLWTIRPMIMLTWAEGEAHKVPVTLVAQPGIHLLFEVGTVDLIIPLTWSYNCHNINFGRVRDKTEARLFFLCYATYANQVMAQAHQKICNEGNLHARIPRFVHGSRWHNRLLQSDIL